jgi:hypothetical protein
VGSQAPNSLWEQSTSASPRDKTIRDGDEGGIHGGVDSIGRFELFKFFKLFE